MRLYNANKQQKRINRFSKRALLSASLLGLLAMSLSPAHADEFTVGHSGANIAFSQNGLTGQGITVAVIDSGSGQVQDLATPVVSKKGTTYTTRVIAQVNYVPDGYTVDRVGHGTHVAGIIAGNGQLSTGGSNFRTFYGIARNANIVSLRVLDSTGQAPVSRVITAIQWCVTNKAMYNIRVMNLSMGHPVGESYTTDPLCQAVEAAWKAGIVVVCSAGNSGRANAVDTPGIDNEGWGAAYGSIQSPGNDPYIITVGAMKQDLSTAVAGAYTGNRAYDRIATYSSRGPTRLDCIMKPDIVAPGNKVISTDATSAASVPVLHTAANLIPFKAYQNTTNNGFSAAYLQLSGTSMAAPVVSGAAALLLQANPNLTPDILKARLMISADKWGQPDGTTDPCTFGAGYLNIPAALACTAIPNQAATSPSMYIDANGNVYVNLDRAIWGTDINGNRAVWGVSGVNDLRAVWGTRAIWGSSSNILDASRAMWGTSVWSDRAIWGSSGSAADFSSTVTNGE